MTPERWRQFRGIFNRAIEQPIFARNRILDQECGTDAELRDEVESLIRSYEDSSTFIDQPAVRLEASEAPGTRARGERITARELLERAAEAASFRAMLPDRERS